MATLQVRAVSFRTRWCIRSRALGAIRIRISPIAMVPGPSTAVVIRQTLRAGRGSAFAATMANELGLVF
jgi:threonine/homoserine/homoserine lactone efflux protein